VPGHFLLECTLVFLVEEADGGGEADVRGEWRPIGVGFIPRDQAFGRGTDEFPLDQGRCDPVCWKVQANQCLGAGIREDVVDRLYPLMPEEQVMAASKSGASPDKGFQEGLSPAVTGTE
jgi:hypothetical protein